MTSKRTKARPAAETTITGVAGGSLGTAANLEDTQVFPIDDLKDHTPGRLDDAASAGAAEPPVEVRVGIPVGTPVPGAATVAAASAPPPNSQAPAPRARTVTVTSSTTSRRSVPALAGVAALVVLLLIGGSGFVSQLDLGFGTGPAGPGATPNALIEAQPSPTAEPKDAGKGNGKCHGKGHGQSCSGG